MPAVGVVRRCIGELHRRGVVVEGEGPLGNGAIGSPLSRLPSQLKQQTVRLHLRKKSKKAKIWLDTKKLDPAIDFFDT